MRRLFLVAAFASTSASTIRSKALCRYVSDLLRIIWLLLSNLTTSSLAIQTNSSSSVVDKYRKFPSLVKPFLNKQLSQRVRTFGKGEAEPDNVFKEFDSQTRNGYPSSTNSATAGSGRY